MSALGERDQVLRESHQGGIDKKTIVKSVRPAISYQMHFHNDILRESQ